MQIFYSNNNKNNNNSNNNNNNNNFINLLERLFSLIYNITYLKLSFPKIPFKNAVLFSL